MYLGFQFNYLELSVEYQAQLLIMYLSISLATYQRQ